ncbi:protein shisa-1-like [Pyxicephalus adspersus]|uniref:protein shisa-1-like n=1 Tax=Pyxicephalus adspersus TaxID=30357 RepID=UPI003B5B7D73
MRAVLVLGLLLVSCSGQEIGEYCHGWADNVGLWHHGFQCPERFDSPDATYCCGSCSLRYCCTAFESRLDQGLCPSVEQEENFQDGLPAVPLPSAVPTYFPFVLILSLFAAFIILGTIAGVLCTKCLKPEEGTSIGAPVPQSRLLDSETSTDTSRHSSSSSASAPRVFLGSNPTNLRPLGTENINMYIPTSFPIMACPPNAPFMHHAATAPPFLQPPFINYGVPADHTILLAPASYVDARNCYSQPPNTYFPVGQNVDLPVGNDAVAQC